jgi:hypothetical protein
MNWGWFFLWLASILLLFFVTGWPVQPAMSDVWGNHYNAKDLTYYAVLYFHYLLGALFFSFLGLGLFRDFIWSEQRVQGSNRQLAFLLAYSMLIASVVAIVFVHRFSPVVEEENQVRQLSAVIQQQEQQSQQEGMQQDTEMPSQDFQ